MQINSNQEKVSNKNIKMRIPIPGSEKNMMRCWLFQSRRDYQAEQFIKKQELKIFWLKIKKTDCPNAESQCYCYLSSVFTKFQNQIKRRILIQKKHDEMLDISIKTRLPG